MSCDVADSHIVRLHDAALGRPRCNLAASDLSHCRLQVASEVMVVPLKVPWPLIGFRDLRLVKLFALLQLKNPDFSMLLSFCLTQC